MSDKSELERPVPIDPDTEDDSDASDGHQQAQTEQIIETGAITTTKGKHVIHCLTIVGHIVIINNMLI